MKLEWIMIIRNLLECLLKLFRLPLYQNALNSSRNPERIMIKLNTGVFHKILSADLNLVKIEKKK
jgi:hypothetical protein